MKAQKTLHSTWRMTPARRATVTPIKTYTATDSANIKINEGLEEQNKELKSMIEKSDETHQGQNILIGNLQSRVKELSAVVENVQHINVDELKPDLSGIEKMVDERLTTMEETISKMPEPAAPAPAPSHSGPSLVGGRGEPKKSHFDVVRDSEGRIASIIQVENG